MPVKYFPPFHHRLVSEEKYLEDRIAHVERNFSALATDLGGMVRKTARLRNKGDKIVKTLQDFATNESGELKKSLEGVAECFSALEDCNHLKVKYCEHSQPKYFGISLVLGVFGCYYLHDGVRCLLRHWLPWGWLELKLMHFFL